MKKLILVLMVALSLNTYAFFGIGGKEEGTKQKASETAEVVPVHKEILDIISQTKRETWNTPFALDSLTGNGRYKVSNMNELIAYFLVDAEQSEFDVDGSGCYGMDKTKYKGLIDNATKRVRNDLIWIGFKNWNLKIATIIVAKSDMSFVFTMTFNLDRDSEYMAYGLDWDGAKVCYLGNEKFVRESFAN